MEFLSSVERRELEKQVAMLTGRRDSRFRRVQQVYDLLDKLEDPKKLKQFQAMYPKIESTANEFADVIERLNDARLELDPTSAVDYQPLESLEDMCCYIHQAAEKLGVLVQEAPPSKREEESVPVAQLPKIELPTFYGDPVSWPLFYDTFSSLIHKNKKLDNIAKVYYLMGSLKGRALDVCAGITPTAATYPIIWDNLVKRYQNPRLLADTYLRKMVDFRPLSGESPEGLHQLAENFRSSVKALKQLALPDLSDFIIASLALSKFDPVTRKAFEMSEHANVPTLQEVVQFAQRQAVVLSQLRGAHSGRKTTAVSHGAAPPKATSKSTYALVTKEGDSTPVSAMDSRPCPICRGPHLIYVCPLFSKSSTAARWKLTERHQLCFNCLSDIHKLPACNSSRTCRICQKRHHSMLHRSATGEKSQSVQVASETHASPPRTQSEAQSLVALQTPPKFRRPVVVLPTAVVRVVAPKGEFWVRFLVDSGSQAHLVTLRCIRKLGLNLRKGPPSLGGIGGISERVRGSVNFVIQSRLRPAVNLEVDALVLQRITSPLPSVQLGASDVETFSELALADPAFDRPGEIEGVLGAAIFAQIVNASPPVKSLNGLTAVATDLGYLIMGSTAADTPLPTPSIEERTLCTFQTPTLETLLRQFWELESVELPADSPALMDECERRFRETTTRNEEGRYVVELPFAEFPPPLGDSYNAARRRLLTLERHLQKSTELLEKYREGVRDYVTQGHASPSPSADTGGGYFLPHFAVCKVSSTTPVRIVFDASCRTTNGKSLNDTLLTGPKLQTDLQEVLLRFRVHPIAVVADLRQMYRNIEVAPTHRRYQQFLWRERPEDPIGVFQINRVPFGLNCAPFLALRSVKQLAEDERDRFPIAARIARRDMYVDDVVASIPEEEVSEAIPQLRDLFKAGGFTLTKWSTNSPSCLESIPRSDWSVDNTSLDKGATLPTGTKVLGLNWNASSDHFFFVHQPSDNFGTKRRILSTLARIWDPLGFIAPVTLLGKYLIQQLWVAKCGWDDPPPDSIGRKWAQIGRELPQLANVRIPRYSGVTQDPSAFLVGFADASEVGFGAVVYCVCRQGTAMGKSTLLLGKSRVAPTQPVTIPRMELCAALLLARMFGKVSRAFPHIPNERVFALSDSEDALHWISKPPATWKTFVANRVAEIQGLVPSERWFHVPGSENVADCISRGLTPLNLVNHPTWWSGPVWITEKVDRWPIRKTSGAGPHAEMKSPMVAVAADPAPLPLNALIQRTSSFTKLCYTFVYILRFSRVLPRRERVLASDLEVAELRILQIVQREYFAEELRLLEQGKTLPKALRRLQPFVDHGTLRVGGRLQYSTLPLETKHPVLLPSKCHLVDILVDYAHQRYLHAGAELLGSLLRRKYWILSARSVIRRRLHLCNRCFRCQPRNAPPLMAPLPAERVTATRAFATTGVDYAGPFTVTLGRYRGVRSQKAYICLFVCFTTRALHLELASDLSTEAFLRCFVRFFARRGPISTLYSDCGTNFVGAKAQLEEYQCLTETPDFKKALGEVCNTHRIEWRFNPPGAPHFGGLWETGVKSVKRHLNRVAGDQILTCEEFQTLLTEIEAVLNSRPLCPLSTDPIPEALTPAHFLNLGPVPEFPLLTPADASTSLTNRKKLLDRMLHSFWDRWHKDYLTSLQPRKKWTRSTSPVQVGDVVVVGEPNSPPLRWPLGIVEEVFPGADGNVRVARVRVGKTSLRRPVVKLFPLPRQ